jgi:hypothetical protein
MKLKNILFATAALALAACSNDDSAPVAISVQANISNSVATRFSGTQFAVNDQIGVNVSSTTTDGKTSASNVLYTAQSTDGKFTSSTPVYYKDANSVNITAYCPFTASTSLTNGVADVDIANPVDYLYASKSAVNSGTATIDMTFSHVMAKLTFTFTDGGGMEADLANLSSFTLKSIAKTGTFNTVTGVLTPSTTAADYSHSSFTNVTNSDNSVDKTATVLFFPLAELASRTIAIDVTYGTITYSATIKAPKFAANYNYNYTVSLKRTGLEISSSTISPWTDTDVKNGNNDSFDATIN